MRRVIATTYATWWRRRWRSEYPTGSLPEVPGMDGTAGIDERDALRRALGTLPRRQRAPPGRPRPALLRRHRPSRGARQAKAPDRLRPHTDGGSRPLAEGTRTRTGTTVEITVPPAGIPDAGERIEIAMGFVTECVAGVRLTFTVPTGGLGSADCDPLGKEMTGGRVGTYVTKQQLAAVGLRPGDRVALTIRSVGRDTDQWRIFPPD